MTRHWLTGARADAGTARDRGVPSRTRSYMDR